VNKRQREEQVEPVAPPTSEVRLLGYDSSEAPASPPHSHFTFTLNSISHPPLSIQFIHILYEISRCESNLNTSTTPLEIHDVLLDCYVLYHQIHDQFDMHPVLLDRNQDLEHNINLKKLRSCHQLIRSAAQLVDDIRSYPLCSHPLPVIEYALSSIDDILHVTALPLKDFYLSVIRPALVRHWENYSDSSSSCSLSASPESTGRSPTQA
jgi:hypothetical protein